MTAYNLNLPNVIVSDIDINYAENKLYAATFGRGVWQNDLLEEMVISTGLDAIDPFKGVDVDLYPNPNNGEFTLTIKGFDGENLKMDIIDVMGRIVRTDQLVFNNGNLSNNYDLDLPDGMYFLKVSTDKRMRTIRFRVD